MSRDVDVWRSRMFAQQGISSHKGEYHAGHLRCMASNPLPTRRQPLAKWWLGMGRMGKWHVHLPSSKSPSCILAAPHPCDRSMQHQKMAKSSLVSLIGIGVWLCGVCPLINPSHSCTSLLASFRPTHTALACQCSCVTGAMEPTPAVLSRTSISLPPPTVPPPPPPPSLTPSPP